MIVSLAPAATADGDSPSRTRATSGRLEGFRPTERHQVPPLTVIIPRRASDKHNYQRTGWPRTTSRPEECKSRHMPRANQTLRGFVGVGTVGRLRLSFSAGRLIVARVLSRSASFIGGIWPSARVLRLLWTLDALHWQVKAARSRVLEAWLPRAPRPRE